MLNLRTRRAAETSPLRPNFMIFRVKDVLLWRTILFSIKLSCTEKNCLPARNKKASLMNCCSMIPIPLSLAVNYDINCYCYIMLTFRVLQNWHNVQNGRIKHREANEWCLGKEGGITLCWQGRMAELFLYLLVMYSLSELAAFMQNCYPGGIKAWRRRGCH